MFKPKKSYDASITDCGLVEGKDGEPQPFIAFNVMDGEGNNQAMTWYGSMRTEAAKEFSATQLIKIGFTGNDFSDLKKGSIMFDGSLKLTVSLEPQQKKNEAGVYVDTDKLKIKWINVKTSKLEKFTGAVPNQVALFSRLKAELGVKKTTSPAPSDW